MLLLLLRRAGRVRALRIGTDGTRLLRRRRRVRGKRRYARSIRGRWESRRSWDRRVVAHRIRRRSRERRRRLVLLRLLLPLLFGRMLLRRRSCGDGGSETRAGDHGSRCRRGQADSFRGQYSPLKAGGAGRVKTHAGATNLPAAAGGTPSPHTSRTACQSKRDVFPVCSISVHSVHRS